MNRVAFKVAPRSVKIFENGTVPEPDRLAEINVKVLNCFSDKGVRERDKSLLRYVLKGQAH